MHACWKTVSTKMIPCFLLMLAFAWNPTAVVGQEPEPKQTSGAAEKSESPAENKGDVQKESADAPQAGDAPAQTGDKPASDKPEGETPKEGSPAKQEGEQVEKGEEAKQQEATAEEKKESKPEEKKQPPKPPKKPEPVEPRKLPKLGASETPMLPNQPWRVHDYLRPRPPVVEPPMLQVMIPPPGDAVVLFDGTDLSSWAHHDREDPSVFYEAQWAVKNGYFEVTRGHGDLFTIDTFSDVQLHLEWMVPENTRGTSQGRGNSGIKFLGMYEVQVLDSYKNMTYADGQAAAIYGQYPPDVNVSRKPGEWQSYDIIFEMPRFEGDKLTSPGYLTVLHNGVLVHHRKELAGVTGLRSPGRYAPHPPAGPIMLQDHGNPIRFRNIWVRRLTH